MEKKEIKLTQFYKGDAGKLLEATEREWLDNSMDASEDMLDALYEYWKARLLNSDNFMCVSFDVIAIAYRAGYLKCRETETIVK